MRRQIITSLSVFLVAALSLASSHRRATPDIGLINIQEMPTDALNKVKENSHLAWWAEFGDTLVVGGDMSSLQESGLSFSGQVTGLAADDLDIVLAGHTNELPSFVKIIARSGRIALVAHDDRLQGDDHFAVRPFAKNTIYTRSSTHSEDTSLWSQTQIDIAKSAMDEVDAVLWYADVGTLTNWNRHVSSVDIVSARDWITERFARLNPTSVTQQKFNLMGRDAWNVVATFDAGPGSDIYIIGGHYDSLSEQTSRSAPGAEDNASGAAGVLELARVFSTRAAKTTLIFITFSGEEEGLIGSKAYVRNLPAEMRSRIKSVMTMDMIGYTKDDSLDVLLETDSKYESLANQYAAASRLVPGLRYFTSYNPWGSDHMPFIDSNIPAILTIDNDWGDYPSYHRTTDTIDKVSRDMGLAILKMNAATLAVMVGS